MTQDEQQQVAAIRAEYEQTIVNLSHQCADKAAIAELWANRAKAAEAKIAQLETKKAKK